MCNLAWETTDQDIQIVLDKNPGLMEFIGAKDADDIVLDHNAITKAALRYDDMTDQTNSALDNIKAQLITKKVYGIWPVIKNPDGSVDQTTEDDPNIHAWGIYSRTFEDQRWCHVADKATEASAKEFMDTLS
jgi:hypothetical protein